MSFCPHIRCISVLNLMWFSSQFTELLQKNCASVSYPEFLGAPCKKKKQEKRRKNLWIGSKKVDGFKNGLDVLYHHETFGKIEQRAPAAVQVRKYDVCMFLFLPVCLSVCRAAGLSSLFVGRRCTLNKYCVTVCGLIFTRLSPLLSKDHGLYGSTRCCISHWPK